MIENINLKITSAHEFLKQTNHLIISYGTSYFYELVNNKKIVNNCHQFPNNYFTKQIGNSNLFKDSFLDLQEILLKINPALAITFTLSPIKHYRDGVIENNLSKSILTCFIHDSISKTKNVEYFPSYEIINDELRDYRFYKDNFTHPSDLAIEIIWEKFKEKNIGERSKEFINNFQTVKKLKTHKINWVCLSGNPNKQAYKLLKNNVDKINWNWLSENTSKWAYKLLKNNPCEINWDWLSRNTCKCAYTLLKNNADKINLDNFLSNPYIFKIVKTLSGQ
jgi:hypothetical protein